MGCRGLFACGVTGPLVGEDEVSGTPGALLRADPTGLRADAGGVGGGGGELAAVATGCTTSSCARKRLGNSLLLLFFSLVLMYLFRSGCAAEHECCACPAGATALVVLARDVVGVISADAAVSLFFCVLEETDARGSGPLKPVGVADATALKEPSEETEADWGRCTWAVTGTEGTGGTRPGLEESTAEAFLLEGEKPKRLKIDRLRLGERPIDTTSVSLRTRMQTCTD